MKSFQILKKNLVDNQMPFWQQGVELDMWQIYELVNTVYPFLCDPTLIIPQDGKTVKWKLYTRFALEDLRKTGVLKKVNPGKRDGRWVKI